MKSTVVSTLLLGPLVVSVLGLAGCSSDESSETPGGPATEATDATSPATSQTPIITDPDVPGIPKFNGNPAGIITDVTTDECTTDPGTVMASGSVVNTAPGPAPRDIAISISWVAEGGSDVLARGVERLAAVPAGATKKWSVKAELDSDVPVLCVPLAQRGQFAGTG